MRFIKTFDALFPNRKRRGSCQNHTEADDWAEVEDAHGQSVDEGKAKDGFAESVAERRV